MRRKNRSRALGIRRICLISKQDGLIGLLALGCLLMIVAAYNDISQNREEPIKQLLKACRITQSYDRLVYEGSLEIIEGFPQSLFKLEKQHESWTVTDLSGHILYAFQGSDSIKSWEWIHEIPAEWSLEEAKGSDAFGISTPAWSCFTIALSEPLAQLLSNDPVFPAADYLDAINTGNLHLKLYVDDHGLFRCGEIIEMNEKTRVVASVDLIPSE